MSDSEAERDRYTPHPLPPYSYVPHLFPHPLSDAEGHGCRGPAAPTKPVSPADWPQCAAYLWGIDLFNQGYYWEAHEAWEGVWVAAGRTGVDANFLKGLIKFAAAGVKAREGRVAGVRRHSRRAAVLFELVREELGHGSQGYWGLSPRDLRDHARALEAQAWRLLDTSPKPVVRVMPFALHPR